MKKPLFIAVLSLNLIGLVIAISSLIYAIIYKQQSTEIVASYQTPEDKIDLEFDDDNHRYEVWVNNQRYYVKVNEAILIPYDENEVYVEITRNGKCKLYFFIKWEVETCIDKIN